PQPAERKTGFPFAGLPAGAGGRAPPEGAPAVVVDSGPRASFFSLAKISTAASAATKKTAVATRKNFSPRAPGESGHRRGITIELSRANTTKAAAMSPRPSLFPVERPKISTARKLPRTRSIRDRKGPAGESSSGYSETCLRDGLRSHGAPADNNGNG